MFQTTFVWMVGTPVKPVAAKPAEGCKQCGGALVERAVRKEGKNQGRRFLTSQGGCQDSFPLGGLTTLGYVITW
jgi:hypothetical protein